jgi:hypothetical protein
MPNDSFGTFAPGLSDPATHGATITPSDSTALANATRAIYVGGAGDLAVKLVGGEQVTLTGVTAGTIYPLRAAYVLSTGTTATNLVGLW